MEQGGGSILDGESKRKIGVVAIFPSARFYRFPLHDPVRICILFGCFML